MLWYVLSPSGPQDPFSIGRYGGRVSLTGPLDFEQCDRYHLQLLAHDGPHEGRANLTVLVEDVNDNAPTFSQSLYQVPTLYGCPYTWVWGCFCWSNKTEVEVGRLGWMLGLILESVGTVPFQAGFPGPVTCIQVLHPVVRRDANSSAKERGSKLDTKYSSWAQAQADRLRGTVGQLGSLPQIFPVTPQVMMLEHTAPGSAILSVSATDRDSGANGHISYHLASPAEGFSVDPSNGMSFPESGSFITDSIGLYLAIHHIFVPGSLIQGGHPLPFIFNKSPSQVYV